MPKKLKCYICGKNEQIVGEKTIRLFCADCVNSNKYIKYKMQEKQKQRLEELNK